MDYGRLPIDEQVTAFRAVLLRNHTLAEVLTRAAVLALPGWYLVAGCLYQTVWNVTTGQPPEVGILDYDLAYFDGSDLSWQAEDAVILAGQEFFGDLPAPVQIRNQAREREGQAAMDAAESPQVLAEDEVPGRRPAQQHARRGRRRHGRDLHAARGAADAMGPWLPDAGDSSRAAGGARGRGVKVAEGAGKRGADLPRHVINKHLGFAGLDRVKRLCRDDVR
jgi:hypothetical protein